MSEDKIELTEEMVNTLDNPPKVNDAFKAAAKKYKGEDIKKVDTTLWLDNNGYRTLDNFSKKELAYYHSSDVKTLKGVVDGLTQQVTELRAALSELINIASECDSWETFPSQYLDEADKVLKESE